MTTNLIQFFLKTAIGNSAVVDVRDGDWLVTFGELKPVETKMAA